MPTPPTHPSGSPDVEVICADALGWLRDHPAQPGCSLFTSLPDVAELGVDLATWEPFFLDAAAACLAAVPDDGVAVFLQTDKKIDERWISKAALVLRAAQADGSALLAHQIVCRHAPGTVSMGRPGFSHLLVLSRGRRAPAALSSADVLLDPGPAAWSHGLGAAVATRALRWITGLSPSTTTVLAPFCGLGEALVAAQAAGLGAVGVERNRKRAARAAARVEAAGQGRAAAALVPPR